MIEMRWIMRQGSYERTLQFRQQMFRNREDADLVWSEWVEVPTMLIDGS